LENDAQPTGFMDIPFEPAGIYQRRLRTATVAENDRICDVYKKVAGRSREQNNH
jgi:hypothetical protein